MQKTIDIKRETPRESPRDTVREAPQPHEDKMKFRMIAREALGDVEHLFSQHLLLTKLEIQRSMQFVKVGAVTMVVALVLGFVGLVALLRALVFKIGEANQWSLSTMELVHGLLNIAIAGICVYIGIKALRKLNQLPQKLSKQWKEEWQWLRKTL